MDAFTAGRLCRSIDPLHSISYFAPEAAARFGAIVDEAVPRVLGDPSRRDSAQGGRCSRLTAPWRGRKQRTVSCGMR